MGTHAITTQCLGQASVTVYEEMNLMIFPWHELIREWEKVGNEKKKKREKKKREKTIKTAAEANEEKRTLDNAKSG